MTIVAGPKVVEDGLVLSYDFANKKLTSSPPPISSNNSRLSKSTPKNNEKGSYSSTTVSRNPNEKNIMVDPDGRKVRKFRDDGDDSYKKFLQNLAAQRKAYLDMIKNKDNPDDIEAAKLQYRKMCKYLTEEFLNEIDDEDYSNNDEE